VAGVRRSGKEATAYHEAGHAVMRLELGRRPRAATVKPDERKGTLGHIAHRATKLDVDYFDPNDWRLRRWADTEIMTALAGPEAERRYSGRRNNVGARSDDERTKDVAWWSEESSERTQAYLTWLSLKVQAYVSSEQVWKGVEAVATALLEKETLSGKEVREAWLSSHRLSASSEATLERLGGDRPRPVAYDYQGWVIKRDGSRFVVNNPEGAPAVIKGGDCDQASFGTLTEATDAVDRALASEHRR
jgi:hypothetical protein